MSGIIGTSAKDWAALTREGLEEDLDVNNALDSSASDYKEKHVDYNGMKSSDLLYKDTYAALNDKDEDDEEDGDATEENRKEFIKNPETHYNLQEKDGKLVYVTDDGTEKPVTKTTRATTTLNTTKVRTSTASLYHTFLCCTIMQPNTTALRRTTLPWKFRCPRIPPQKFRCG